GRPRLAAAPGRSGSRRPLRLPRPRPSRRPVCGPGGGGIPPGPHKGGGRGAPRPGPGSERPPGQRPCSATAPPPRGPRAPPRPARAGRVARARPWLEPLEDRTLPSGWPPAGTVLSVAAPNEPLDQALSVGTLDTAGTVGATGTLGKGPAGAADVQWFQFTLSG